MGMGNGQGGRATPSRCSTSDTIITARRTGAKRTEPGARGREPSAGNVYLKEYAGRWGRKCGMAGWGDIPARERDLRPTENEMKARIATLPIEMREGTEVFIARYEGDPLFSSMADELEEYIYRLSRGRDWDLTGYPAVTPSLDAQHGKEGQLHTAGSNPSRPVIVIGGPHCAGCTTTHRALFNIPTGRPVQYEEVLQYTDQLLVEPPRPWLRGRGGRMNDVRSGNSLGYFQKNGVTAVHGADGHAHAADLAYHLSFLYAAASDAVLAESTVLQGKVIWDHPRLYPWVVFSIDPPAEELERRMYQRRAGSPSAANRATKVPVMVAGSKKGWAQTVEHHERNGIKVVHLDWENPVRDARFALERLGISL